MKGQKQAFDPCSRNITMNLVSFFSYYRSWPFSEYRKVIEMNLPFWLDTSTKLFRWNAYTLFFIFFTLLNNLQLYIICRYNNCPIHETLADITFTDYLFILSGHQLQTWYCQFCQVYYTKIMFLKIHPVFTLLTHTFKVYHYGLHF